MTDSMNFGPEWLRNLSSDGSTTGLNTGGTRYQLADYRYGREEMLALFDKGLRAPPSLSSFLTLYSETSLPPLALLPSTDEERQWSRVPPMGPSVRGGRGAAGGPGERGGRVSRGGRGSYPYGGRAIGYESGGSWGGVDNWRRGARSDADDEDRWRSGHTPGHPGRGGISSTEKWSRSSSWREGDDERGGVNEKPLRSSWHEGSRSGVMAQRRVFDNEDHLPEWVHENLGEGGGTFDASGAFHGSDEEQEAKGFKSKEHPLQKSVSQQNITSKTQQQHHAPLSTSKSAMSLSKPPEPINNREDEVANHVQDLEQLKAIEEKAAAKAVKPAKEEPKAAPPPVAEPVAQAPPAVQQEEAKPAHQKVPHPNQIQQYPNIREDTENRELEFERLQEDLVLKLVVDEETPTSSAHIMHTNGVQPPPNMMPVEEKWYYQDPQGDCQGPFLSTEMAEWYKAGYFTTTLFVRRQCDERFYTLGDLVTHCGGNPFQSAVPIAPLKAQEPQLLQLQYLQAQLAMRAAHNRPFGQGEPRIGLNTLQQRELMAQQISMLQTHLPPESFMQPPNTTNPLMHMINQMQQVNKMPVQPPVVDKPTNPLPCPVLDPLQVLVQQMGGLQPIQNRIIPPTWPQNIVPPPMKHEPTQSMHGMAVNGMPGTTPGPVPVIPNNMMPKPAMAKMDGDNNMNVPQFLRKRQYELAMDLEPWRKTQFNQPTNPQPQTAQPTWQPTDKPISMWDMPTSPNLAATPPDVHQMNAENASITKEKQLSDASKEAAKEEKKRKEAEEKQAKKEAEEKRKAEQRKQEAEKKQLEEKKRKDEEKVRRELEKAKKEAEEKRQRELAEKRRLKEQRKVEEEARKKADELKKLEEIEREKLAAKEREEQQKKQAEYARQAALASQKVPKAAPWSQAASNQGLSLSEIQKLERERKAEQVALLQQQQRMQLQLQEQTSPEKPANIHLNWANKPVKPGKVKSLAEIQAEEQERLLKVKQANEKAMAQKEKETLSPPTSGIWNGQSLTWTNNDNSPGFWDEPPRQQPTKPAAPEAHAVPAKVAKQSATAAACPKQPAAAKPAKKAKKDEQGGVNNGSTTDEFADWCTKTLANMNTQVDIPTFVGFLRDIESALDVREYCRDYLGDKPATQQFAAQFLEKRRLFKPKSAAHKDDMCSPAPAITPSSQHTNDFQEVKGKGKKCKKSKMLKVDARILGFNVTAAQDRINVGDRDYGDT